MANRIQNVLASIFLPRDSVYADLDDPPDIESPPRSPSIPIPLHLHNHNQAQHSSSLPSPFSPPTSPQGGTEVNLLVEPDDPFAPSPSVLSPVNIRFNNDRIPANANLQHIPVASTSNSNFNNQMNDSKSPFHETPNQNSSSSIYLNPTPSSSRSPRRSTDGYPTTSNNSRGKKMNIGASSSSHLANSESTSAIGNRSLMGLLGGTRYGVRGFEGIELGPEVLEEEEDEDDLGNGRGRGRARDLSL